MAEAAEEAIMPARIKRSRPLSDPERREKVARSLSSRPQKKINKPTLTELAAVKYANGAMDHSALKMKFKGLKKTMEETTENIKNASMKTAGTSYKSSSGLYSVGQIMTNINFILQQRKYCYPQIQGSFGRKETRKHSV